MHAQRLEVMLTHRNQGDVAVGEDRNLRAVRGMDGIAGLVIADCALDVGDVLHAEERQLPRRHMPNLFALIHHLFALVHLIFPAALAACSCVPTIALLGERSAPSVIAIVHTRLSTSGRTRSICRSPLSSWAPLTSMPSARTK